MSLGIVVSLWPLAWTAEALWSFPKRESQFLRLITRMQTSPIFSERKPIIQFKILKYIRLNIPSVKIQTWQSLSQGWHLWRRSFLHLRTLNFDPDPQNKFILFQEWKQVIETISFNKHRMPVCCCYPDLNPPPSKCRSFGIATVCKIRPSNSIIKLFFNWH